MSLTTLIDTGSSDNRVDIVFMGDGYTANEIETTYRGHVGGFVEHMFSDDPLTSPFYQYRNFFNVHAIDVVSNESGVDDPGNDITRDTALGASYRWDGVTDRLLYVDPTQAFFTLRDGLEGAGFEAEMRFITTNSEKYGGGGGTYAVYAGGNSFAYDIALHEIGHSFAGLADEYSYGGPETHSGNEPYQPNSTTDPTGAKWEHWIGYDDPVTGVVGVYEGSSYSRFGAYRPSENSKMRALNQAFDPIAKEAFVLGFYEYVDPLDDWTERGGSMLVFDNDPLQVTVIDTAVIDVAWFIDGVEVETDAGITEVGDVITFDYAELDLAGGSYDIVALAYDATGLVRRDIEQTQQRVTWSVDVDGPLLSMGTTGRDVLSGTTLEDRILALEGQDTVFGSLGDDELVGGAGGDLVSYSQVQEGITLSLHGSFASGAGWQDAVRQFEHATGSNFNDDLTGSAGNTVLKGLLGNDVLNGFAGNNTLEGGRGNDTLNGAGGNDILHGGNGADILRGGAGDDQMFGNDGADVMLGAQGADLLIAGRGADELRGGADADELRGKEGADVLIGGTGADTLNGGRGNDRLSGGNGTGADDGARDVFIYAPSGSGGGGLDRITDFVQGSDVIDLSAFGFTDFTAQVLAQAADSASGLRISFSATDVLIVQTMAKVDFDAADVLL